MSACVSIVLFVCFFLLSRCVTLHRYSDPEITSKTKIELSPIVISCTLSDIVVISAPIVKNARYYLHNPEGEAIKLNISLPTYPHPKDNFINNEYEDVVIKYTNNFKSITPINNYKIYNLVSKLFDTTDLFAEYMKKINSNDFIIGPVIENDHGNWVLSAYTQDEDGEWAEIFQVITIEITEYIPPKPRIAKLHEGDTFEFSFAHPIAHVTSCELTAPRSTFDRFYERDHVTMDACGYLIKNVTKQDQGNWRITAVGKIVYRTQVYLEVLNCVTCNSLVSLVQ